MRSDAKLVVPVRRDYALDGEETRKAVAAGLADGDWYQPPIDPERLRQLTERRNGRPAACCSTRHSIRGPFTSSR